MTGSIRRIAIWAAATALGLGASAGLCRAGERHSSRPATPRPSAARTPNLLQLLVKALGGTGRTSPGRTRPTADATAKAPRGDNHARLHQQLAAALARASASQNGPRGTTGNRADLGKLLTSALAGAGGTGQQADLANVPKLLAAMLAGTGATGEAIDTAALEQQLSAALTGAGPSGGQGKTLDLAALKTLVAGMLTGTPSRPAGAKGALPSGMSSVLLSRAREAMAGGDLADARGIIERVMTHASQGDPAFGTALRMSVRMETVTRDLASRAERARRSGDHVARAGAMMKLSPAAGDCEQGRRARAWLASAREDPALSGAVDEARARQVAAALARDARSARRTATQGDELIVTDTTRHPNPLIDDLAHTPPARRKALLAEARRRLSDLAGTPTARRVLEQLTDLEAGKPPRRSPAARGNHTQTRTVLFD